MRSPKVLDAAYPGLDPTSGSLARPSLPDPAPAGQGRPALSLARHHPDRLPQSQTEEVLARQADGKGGSREGLGPDPLSPASGHATPPTGPARPDADHAGNAQRRAQSRSWCWSRRAQDHPWPKQRNAPSPQAPPQAHTTGAQDGLRGANISAALSTVAQQLVSALASASIGVTIASTSGERVCGATNCATTLILAAEGFRRSTRHVPS
jgi:hypothetical protein